MSQRVARMGVQGHLWVAGGATSEVADGVFIVSRVDRFELIAHRADFIGIAVPTIARFTNQDRSNHRRALIFYRFIPFSINF